MAILNDVLDLSKIEAGKLEISPVDSNIHDVFKNIHKLFLARADEVGIALTLQIGESVPQRLRFDTVRVGQCMSNLVSNAVKFTETGGVRISAYCVRAIDGARLVNVDITDTGVGMSEEVISRLFVDFAQADASTSRMFGGTGLGLAISRKLARLMGGDVTVKSKAGEGTVFRFSFRAAPARHATLLRENPASQPRPDGEMVLEGLRILLVDDNAVNPRSPECC